MKRLKIFKAYFILWLFVYFIAISNLETFKLYFLSTLTFNIAIVSLLAVGTFMLFKAGKDLTMVTGTFGVLMYKKGDISFYIKGIEKIFPSHIAQKIKMRAQSQNLLFTQQEAEDILAWLEEKYSNQNKYNNFFIGTVLMIGLLGTFAGLLGSIASMGSIVSSLAGSNVNISKIMADFAILLSSMAVGFGSSLFGVISAILLSIKGYILNKAQESLLSGVENWLQSKTVEKISDENKAGALVPASTLESRQKSYMDIFVEEISSLSTQMREVALVNREFQSSFIDTVQELKTNASKEQELLYSMKGALESIASSTVEQSAKSEMTQRQVQAMLQRQEHQSKQLENISLVSAKQEQAHTKIDHLIAKMVTKQEKKEEENKMNIFHMADALESMDKNIKQRMSKLESLLEKQHHPKEEKHTVLEDTVDFMKKHFSHEDKV